MPEYVILKQKLREILQMLPDVRDERLAEKCRLSLRLLDVNLTSQMKSSLSEPGGGSQNWEDLAQRLGSVETEVRNALESQHSRQLVIHRVEQQAHLLATMRSSYEERITALERDLQLAQESSKHWESQLRGYALTTLPPHQLLEILIEVLSSKSQSEITAMQNQLRAFFFSLEELLQKMSIIPLSSLRQIKTAVARIDAMETKLMYYREKISRAEGDEINYWKALREREVHRAINS